MAVEDRGTAESSLRRIEELVGALEHASDPAAREQTGELLRTVLEVHGLAFARTVALMSQAPGGGELLDRLGRDEQVRPVLLLHGLHPEELDTRVRRAVDGLRAEMRDRGVLVELAGLSRGSAKVRVRRSGTGAVASAALREEIEAVVLEAAPDLDALDIHVDEGCAELAVLVASPAAASSRVAMC